MPQPTEVLQFVGFTNYLFSEFLTLTPRKDIQGQCLWYCLSNLANGQFLSGQLKRPYVPETFFFKIKAKLRLTKCPTKWLRNSRFLRLKNVSRVSLKYVTMVQLSTIVILQWNSN